MEVRELIDFKDNLRKVLINVYIQRGYNWNYFYKTAISLRDGAVKKTKSFNDKTLAPQIRGEIVEIILEVKIMDFARRNNLDWFLIKSLTIDRTDHKARKTTELDLTLFTPTHTILFEVKSRKGKYKLVDECNLLADGFGYSSNIYKQNIMHLDNLRHFLGDAILTLQKEKPFKIVLFLDDICNCTDLRTVEAKKKYPLITMNNIDKFLQQEMTYKSKVWDMNKLKIILKDLNNISADNFLRHMNIQH